SAKALLPIDTVAPPPSVPLPAGQAALTVVMPPEAVPDALLALLPAPLPDAEVPPLDVVALLLLALLPPPQPARTADQVARVMARTMRFMVSPRRWCASRDAGGDGELDQAQGPVEHECEHGDEDGSDEHDPVALVDPRGDDVTE